MFRIIGQTKKKLKLIRNPHPNHDITTKKTKLITKTLQRIQNKLNNVSNKTKQFLQKLTILDR